MTKTEILKAIKSGRFFSCKFVKQDGTLRTLRGRAGVRRYKTKDGIVRELTGKGMKYDAKGMGYHVVFDLDKREYRMVNLITLVEFNGVLLKASDVQQ
jgi:hypothetical protein